MAEDLKFPENVEKLIDELNSEFKEKIDKFPGNFLLENKLFNINNLLTFQYEKTCGYLIRQVKIIEKNKNPQQAKGAVQELEKCLKPFNDIMQEHRRIKENFIKIFRNQNLLCFKECYDTHGEKDEIKPCMRECIDNFDKYTLTAFGELYSEYLDDMNENLMKNI